MRWYSSFLRRLTTAGQSDLHEHDLIAALDSQIGRIVDQAVRWILRNGLKAVLGWDLDGLDHGLMNAVRQSLPVLG
jgi:hypothetical protein